MTARWHPIYERDVHYTWTESPVGRLVVAGDDQGLRLLGFAQTTVSDEWKDERTPLLDEAVEQIESYFAGTRKAFDLPLRPEGTAFQQDVWKALLAIPYGQTISYAELAQRLGRSGAQQAVGQANGANPIAIIIPCHRVVGAEGDLVGYGGGLPAKRKLLDHERGQGSLWSDPS